MSRMAPAWASYEQSTICIARSRGGAPQPGTQFGERREGEAKAEGTDRRGSKAGERKAPARIDGLDLRMRERQREEQVPRQCIAEHDGHDAEQQGRPRVA